MRLSHGVFGSKLKTAVPAPLKPVHVSRLPKLYLGDPLPLPASGPDLTVVLLPLFPLINVSILCIHLLSSRSLK